jgi:hypothetical protein
VALLDRVHKAEALLGNIDSHKLDPNAPRNALQLKPRAPSTAPDSASLKKNPEMSSLGGLSPHPDQQDLWTGLQVSSAANSTKAMETTSPANDETPVKKPATTAEPEVLPQLALEDACRILKVVAGDPWEKVELARRKIVSKTSPLVIRGMPSAQTQKLLSEAQMANDAAIVIAARRCGRQ